MALQISDQVMESASVPAQDQEEETINVEETSPEENDVTFGEHTFLGG
jgi:hypothetical protein